jgi:hypothetical protein
MGRKSKAQVKWEQMTEGKVLVAKPGKEQEFLKAMQDAHNIGHGSLGWQGQAEIMYKTGIHQVMGIKIRKGTSETAAIKKVKECIIGLYMSSIYENSEWVTPEVAEKRKIANAVLYGPNPSVGSGESSSLPLDNPPSPKPSTE